MRNESAGTPLLAELAPPMPRLTAVEFTHEVIGRDDMNQSPLDGAPGG